MNIAIIGSRGIPGNYGGFETFAERFSIGMVRRGHKVTVYCPSSYSKLHDKYYNNVRRIIIPNIKYKYLDKMSSSFLSCIHSVLLNYEIILFLGVSPIMFSWIPKLSGAKIVINIDGIEWKREKWNKIASWFLKMSEHYAMYLCDLVISDSKVIQKYIYQEYGKDSIYIAYGADVKKYDDEKVLKKYGLKKDNYILVVCRLEPENNTDFILNEYNKLETEIPLIILGDSPFNIEYKNKLLAMADKRVKFLGAIYGYEYNVIRSNPFCYIHGHEVGGTNPALLEAMGAGNCVIVLDVPFNLEVIGNSGLSFSKKPGELYSVLKKLIANREIIKEYKKKSMERIKLNYSWNKIIDEYEKALSNLIENK